MKNRAMPSIILKQLKAGHGPNGLMGLVSFPSRPARAARMALFLTIVSPPQPRCLPHSV